MVKFIVEDVEENKLTCGLSSFQRLAALLTDDGVDVDQVLCQWVETLQDHGGCSSIHKDLRKKMFESL